jgi:hypothetical protein
MRPVRSGQSCVFHACQTGVFLLRHPHHRPVLSLLPTPDHRRLILAVLVVVTHVAIAPQYCGSARGAGNMGAMGKLKTTARVVSGPLQTWTE